MMTCIPESFFKWSFRVEGAATPAAGLSFDFFAHEGGIVYGDTEYEVRRHGLIRREWTLEDHGRAVASAALPGLFSLGIRVEEEGRAFLVTREPWGDGFEIRLGDAVAGVIHQEHIFTRRTVIDCGPGISERAQLFCFWLTLNGPFWRGRMGLPALLQYHQTTVKPITKRANLS